MKNIYEMFNDIETNLEDYEQQEFSEFEVKKWQQKMKKQVHKNKIGKKVAVAACAVMCLAVPFHSQVAAAMGSATEAFTTWITWGVAEKNITPYEKVINTSVVDDKIEVKLESVILDDHELLVSTIQKYPNDYVANPEKIQGTSYCMDLDSSFEEIREAFEERKLSRPGYPCMPMAVTIDGKVKQGREIVDPCEVDEGEIRVIYKYFMDEKEPIELNEKIRIKIELQEVTGISDGKWEFEFEADGKQLKVDTLTVPLSQKVKLPQGGEIILTEYKRNPLGTYIYYEGIGVKDYIIQLRGTTDRGQTVWFMDYGFGRPELGRFELYQLNDMRAENIKNLNLSVYWHELGEGHSSEGNYKQYGEEFTLEIEESAK